MSCPGEGCGAIVFLWSMVLVSPLVPTVGSVCPEPVGQPVEFCSAGCFPGPLRPLFALLPRMSMSGRHVTRIVGRPAWGKSTGGRLTLGMAGWDLRGLPPASVDQGWKLHRAFDQVLGGISTRYRACTSHRLAETASSVQETLGAIIERLLLLYRVVEHLAKAGAGRRWGVFKNARFLNTC